MVIFGSDGVVIFFLQEPLAPILFNGFWVTQPSPLTDFQPPDHCFQWFFDGLGVIQPLVSMVFNGHGPLVQRCDGFDGSFTSILIPRLTTKIGQFPCQNRMPRRQSAGTQLDWKCKCHNYLVEFGIIMSFRFTKG